MTDKTPPPSDDDNPAPLISSMKDAAIAVNEMVISLVAGGFSREEAIRFCAIWLVEQGRATPPGTDDK